MEPFQRAIEDEKKARTADHSLYTGAGSLGCGLTNSTYGWPLAEAEGRGRGIFDDTWAGSGSLMVRHPANFLSTVCVGC